MIIQIQKIFKKPDDSVEPIPLKLALKKYWIHYLGVLAYLPLIISLTYFLGNNGATALIGIILFFAAAFMASRPVWKYGAPYSFWSIACILWVAWPVFLGILILGFHMAFMGESS